MKTILFLVLCSPLAAHASYSCTRVSGLSLNLTVDESDPAQVVVYYGHEQLSATLAESEPSPFGSKTYEVKSPGKRDGDEIEGKLTITEMPVYSRVGAFCGRAECPPHVPSHAKANISATLVLGSDEPVEFTCDETVP